MNPLPVRAMTDIAVHGAAGRMGRTVIETAGAPERGERVVCGIDTVEAELPVPTVTSDNIGKAMDQYQPAAVIDFSVPEASTALAEACVDAGVALVIGTTGFDAEQLGRLEDASEQIPLLKATNFSRGIQALLAAMGPALEALEEYDVEVVETHHNGKDDAPSGTAKTILDRIGEYRDFDTVAGRDGFQPRADDEVGMLVRRAGDIRGEHEVMLAGNDEVLTLTHRAEDRGVFAAGALDAAAWLAGRDPGWYAFSDVVDG